VKFEFAWRVSRLDKRSASVGHVLYGPTFVHGVRGETVQGNLSYPIAVLTESRGLGELP
jgi:hypothetical protein